MTARVVRRRSPGLTPFGPGWELAVRGRVVVRVTPQHDGWLVSNRLAHADCVVRTRAEAEALAERLARLAAAP